ncbi:MAG: hypothetical protein V4850_37110 [Myxococcota bacterium]
MRPLGCFLALMPACDFRTCDPVDAALVSLLPERLSESGLYAGPDELLAEGVIAYTPRFALWSDGADKTRWLSLPVDTVIDTTDPDEWRFPEGTRAWKEFVRDGVRVETRMLEKVGAEDDAWVGVAYVWNDDATDAVATLTEVPDARGTAHDVPAAEACGACHGGRSSFVLGFSAVQLSGAEGYGLEDLAAEGRLSATVAAPTVPGDDLDQEALGYLHANCSHCHNPDRPERDGARCYDPQLPINFSLLAGSPPLDQTPALATARDFLGDADGSVVLHRISTRDNSSMPPLATEEVDPAAVAALTAWIDRL